MEEISARENAVSKIEDVVALKASADKGLADLQDQRNALKADRDAFESYKLGETSRLNELRIEAQKETDNVMQARKQIDDEVQKRVAEALKNLGK